MREALASIEKGGYPEALARVACLLGRFGEPLPLDRLQLAHDLLEEYRDMLPALERDEVRRIAGQQQTIVRYARDRALETLPALFARPGDSERLVELLERVFNDERVQLTRPTVDQKTMYRRIRDLLAVTPRQSHHSKERAATPSEHGLPRV